MAIKLAIFDMDGTVFESHLNWPAIRKELNLENKNILKEIFQPDRVDLNKLEILEKYEEMNTRKSKPIPGIPGFIAFLKSKQVSLTLTTNNSKKNTKYLLQKFKLEFETVITREMKLWKPDPDAFNYLMRQFQAKPDETITIGDSEYDIQASRHAKIPYIFIKINEYLKKAVQQEPNVVFFTDFLELKAIIKSLFFN